jgi:transposase-like protein
MSAVKRFSPEARDRAVRLVAEHRREHECSQWAAIVAVAPLIGCTAETVRRWVRHSEGGESKPSAGSASESERVAALERENRELKRANEILRKASAFFAQAELDRNGK